MKKSKASEESKREARIKSVKGAGAGAEFLGIATLIGTTGFLCVQQSYYDFGSLLLWFSVIVIVAGYFVWSGNYIKNNRGKATSALLLLNSIACLLAVRGIIPIFICIASISGLASFKALQVDGKFPIKHIKGIGISKKEIIIFCILAVVGFSLVIWANNTRANATPIISTAVQQAKDKVDTLTQQYQTCSTDLSNRRAGVDTTNQTAVDSYNTDYNACEAVRVQQNEAVTDYNALIGH